MRGGGKRSVEDRASHHHVEGNKLRCLSGAVLAAIEKDMLRQTNLEHLIRRVVAEEMDRLLSMANIPMQWRDPQQQITESTAATRKLHLYFISCPPAESTFTNTMLEGECGDTIRVRLMDVTTGQLVTEGPESVAELEVVPLMGDFNIPDEEDWTANEFERHVARERQGKGQLLAGQRKVYLKGGLGTLGHMYFTDNSSWTRSKRFRLGVRAIALDEGVGLASIREGKSQAFFVKESRGRVYQKHDIPSPNDEVWRLRHIAKDGPNHSKLTQHGIHTVQDFLLWVQERPQDLKEVLGKMPAKAYEGAVKHAMKCVLGDRMYVYPVNQPPYEEVIFDQNYQTVGAIAQGEYVGLDMINDTEKVQVDGFVKSAYNNWVTNVAECMVGDAASAEEPLVDMAPTGTAADGLATDAVQNVPLPPYIQAPDDDLINNAMAAEQSINIELITASLWDYHNSADSLWKYVNSTNVDVDDEGLTTDNITRHVNEVLFEGYEDPRVHALTPPASRWWLRIRAVVRCALFIRNARFMQQQPPDYHTL